jgi:hypothetical protein
VHNGGGYNFFHGRYEIVVGTRGRLQG